MSTIIQKVKNWFQTAKSKVVEFINRVLAYIPTALPTGLKEAQVWSESIIKMAKLPYNDSIKFALCMQVLHFKQEAISHIPKIFFVRSLHKAAANQVMSQIATDLKDKQAAEQKAAQLAATQSQVAADVQAPSVQH